VSEQVALLERKIGKELEDRKLYDSPSRGWWCRPPSSPARAQPQEGFLLSRINGVYTLGEILKVLPARSSKNRLMLHELIERSIVRLKDQGTDTDAALGRSR